MESNNDDAEWSAAHHLSAYSWGNTDNIGLLQIETKYTTSLMTPQLLDSLSGCSITGKKLLISAPNGRSSLLPTKWLESHYVIKLVRIELNWDKWWLSSSISALQCVINSCKQAKCVELMRREHRVKLRDYRLLRADLHCDKHTATHCRERRDSQTTKRFLHLGKVFKKTKRERKNTTK